MTAVAIVEKYRAYGGPEEGGWYYTRAIVIGVFPKMHDAYASGYMHPDYSLVSTLTEEELEEECEWTGEYVNWGVPFNASKGEDYALGCPYFC